MKRTNIHLSKVMIEDLDNLSKKKGISRAEYIRRVLDLHIEKTKENDGNE
ncbi:hypothetical protein JCM16358_11950 [Halanaerocella petrolearia]